MEAKSSGDKENKQVRKLCTVTADNSAMISGLKCFMLEFAKDMISNLVEAFFNLDAKPFRPIKPSNNITGPLSLN